MQKQNPLLSKEHLISPRVKLIARFTPSSVHKQSESTSIHPCLEGRRAREQQHTCVRGDLSLALGSFLSRLFVLTRDFPALHSGLISRLQTCPFLTFCVCLCPGSRLHFWTAFVFAFPVPDLGVVFRCQIYLLLWIICGLCLGLFTQQGAVFLDLPCQILLIGHIQPANWFFLYLFLIKTLNSCVHVCCIWVRSLNSVTLNW